MSGSPPRTVLLDRDGVLNVDRPDYVLTPEQLIVERGASAGVALLTRLGFTLLVITNQAAVAKGLITRPALDSLNALLCARLAAGGGRIAGIYLCPHGSDEGCACRKPRPGLIHQARAEHGFDPAATWFVGDAERDVQAARAAGCRPAVVRTGKGAATAATLPGVPAFADLEAFAEYLAAEPADAR